MAASPDLRPLSQLLEGLPHRLVGPAPQTTYAELRDDSREVQPRDLYLAIAGARSDGHDFVLAAAKQGASAHIVQEQALAQHQSAWAHLSLIVVQNTTALRAKLAGNHQGWPSRDLDLVGITGTNGKTTVTHLLSSLWQSQGLPCARLGTTDNQIVDQSYPARFTTPFPIELQSWLAKAKNAGARAMALEVSSHAIAQGRVDELAFRAIALTSFSQDHLDFHSTMLEYLNTKCDLARRLHPNSIAVAPLSAGAPEFEAAATFLDTATQSGAKAMAVALENNSQAEVYCEQWTQNAHGIQAKVQSPWGLFEIHSPLVGAFNLENLLCACTIALDMGMPVAALQTALPHCQGAPGRLERVIVPQPNKHPAVYVDYAHTPDAVSRASATLKDAHSGDLITVLGCGGDRDRAKRPLMANAALEYSDYVIFSSDNPRTEDPEAILDDMVIGLARGSWTRVCDRGEAIKQAIERATPKDRVLIAGKGHEDYQIIGTTKHPFDDREQAKLALLQSLSGE